MSISSILWPIDPDQAMHALYLTEKLGIAYELIEVRNGIGAGKIFHNGRKPIGTIEAVKNEIRDVLGRAFADEGADKRAGLRNLSQTLDAAWRGGGVAQREIEAFVDAL